MLLTLVWQLNDPQIECSGWFREINLLSKEVLR
jgi:hypothetical protein